MSIGKLGSYNQLLSSLHQLVLSMPRGPVAPVSAAPAPQPPVAPQPTLPRDSYVPSPRRDPSTFFMSQVRDSRWNPNATRGNTNCGPASLAMALKALGITPPGLTDPQNAESWIDATRMAMEGDTNDFKLTSDDDVLKGALMSGANAEKVESLSAIDQALDQGRLVVLAGNPQSYENRLSNQQYDHFNGGHFILVEAHSGDSYTISDPQAHQSSITVSKAELQAYMAYQNWNTGIAVWKR